MKIDLNKIDRESFIVTEGTYAGQQVFRVQPQHIGCAWTKQNLIFRSSVWDAQGNPVSLSFPKFFNLTEKPNVVPDPDTLKGTSLLEKVDGSTLICSRYRGELIMRTRGTFDASLQENGAEIALLKKKYAHVLSMIQPDTTFLFEWTTPTNVIVINYGQEPDMKLIGVVHHEDYSLMSQDSLDFTAQQLNVARPRRYQYPNLMDLIRGVKTMVGLEGLCIYYNKDQDIKKVKSDWYLACHVFKSNCNVESIIDLWLSFGQPDYPEFLTNLSTSFDFECMKLAMPLASQVADAAKEVKKIVNHMQQFVENIRTLPDRKAQAQQVIASYGTTNRASFVFTLLDGRPLLDKDIKKLLFQVLK